MAARRSGATAKRKSPASKGSKTRAVSSARANKLAAFGFTGFLVLMAGAAAIALDLPAKAASLFARALAAAERFFGAGLRFVLAPRAATSLSLRDARAPLRSDARPAHRS